MAGTNEILTWAQGVGANVATQSAFNGATARTAGVGAGVADSSLYNKVTRQSAFITAALSQWLVDETGGSVLDNGDVNNVKSLLTTSVQVVAQALVNASGFATVGAMNAADNGLQAQITAEVAARASQDGNLYTDYLNRIAAEATARSNADVTEANTRFAQDTILQNNFTNYVQRSGNFANAQFKGAVTRGITTNNTLNLNCPVLPSPAVGWILVAMAGVNVSSGVQPCGCDHILAIDGNGGLRSGLIADYDNTAGAMTLFFVGGISFGAHRLDQQYAPAMNTGYDTGGPLGAIGMSLSYILIPG